MASDTVIQVENLGKRYTIGHESGERYLALRDVVARNARGLWNKTKDLVHGKPVIAGDTLEEIWALRNVSFEVKRGEVIGIIGRNGAGKSTLLKILSRISEPTEGRAVIRGRVASLLEVGTGFHPELTGRQNIYLNGSILGMTRKEIDRKFDEIVDFSGVEKFIDTPVKRYSSGMSVRLGFAVAAHVEPEILIVDEVLAVGDFEFQRRCLGKMNEVAQGGRTILLVSHNLPMIESMATRAILMNRGTILAEGTGNEAITAHLHACGGQYPQDGRLIGHHGRHATATPLMRFVVLRNEAFDLTDTIPMKGTLRIEVRFSSPTRIEPVLGVVIKTNTGTPVFGIDNRVVRGFRFGPSSDGTITCSLEKLPLMPGRYSVDLYLGDSVSSLDRIINAIEFSVSPTNLFDSGRLPSPNCGALAWPAAWAFESTRESTAYATT